MSTTGPRLTRTRRGYGVAKFNGRSVHFGFFDDPATHERYDAAKARWLANGREWSDDLQSRARGAAPELPARRPLPRSATPSLRTCKRSTMRRGIGTTTTASAGPWSRCGRCSASIRRAGLILRRSNWCGNTWCRPAGCRAARSTAASSRFAAASRGLWFRSWCRRPTAQALRELKGLRAGEFGVREGRQVRPVDRATIEATLPHLSSQLAAVVELLWHTGARPSEILTLRPRDVDRTVGKSWVATLQCHKLAKLGKPRAILFGPKAQRFLSCRTFPACCGRRMRSASRRPKRSPSTSANAPKLSNDAGLPVGAAAPRPRGPGPSRSRRRLRRTHAAARHRPRGHCS